MRQQPPDLSELTTTKPFPLLPTWPTRTFAHPFPAQSSWCTLIAKRTFTLQHGARTAQPPATYSGMLNALATSAYRAAMVGTSVVVSFALAYVPYVGPPAGFAFLCWIDA